MKKLLNCLGNGLMMAGFAGLLGVVFLLLIRMLAWLFFGVGSRLLVRTIPASIFLVVLIILGYTFGLVTEAIRQYGRQYGKKED